MKLVYSRPTNIPIRLQCSTKCGPGKSIRSVRCRRDTSFVDDKHCSKQEKPNDEQSCNLKKCEPQNGNYRWFSTSFSPVSYFTSLFGSVHSEINADNQDVALTMHS